MSAHAVSAFDDGAGIHEVGAAKEYERYGHKQSGIVDGRKELFQIEADGILGGNDFYVRTVAALLVIEVLNRGEFQVDHDDLVAWTAEIKTG